MVSTRSLISAGAVALASGASAVVIDLPVIRSSSYDLVKLEIGTPAENYLLRLDTGSATTWIYDKNCSETCPNASGYDRIGYNATDSHTGKFMDNNATIQHSGESIYGNVTTDFIHATPAEWNQTFIAAQRSSWSNLPADGILGLAFASIAEGGADSIAETLLWRGALNQPRFGVFIGSEAVPEGETKRTDGVVTIGKSREERYIEGDLVWTDLQKADEYQHWQTDIGSITTSTNNGDSDEEPTEKAISLSDARAVFDTGAASISLPEAQTVQLYESLGMSWDAILNGQHVPLCSDFNSTWSVTFRLGPESESEVEVRGDQLRKPGFAERDDACFPPFIANESSGNVVLGRNFLQNFYTVHDFGAFEVKQYKPRIGLGKLKDEFQP